MGVPVPRTPAGGCPLGPFSHFGPRPLTAANTGARGARAPYKSGRASRRLREYLARFLGVSGADFNAAPLGKPPLRPPRRGAKNRRLYIGISHFPPSPIFHLHLFPGMRTPLPHMSPIFRKKIFHRIFMPAGAASENSRSWRVLANAIRGDWFVRISNRFCRSFHLSRNDEIASKIIARNPF